MRIELTGNDLKLEQVLGVARGEAEVRLHAEALGRMEASRAMVERMLESGAAVYGVNTGFGKLAEKRISPGQIRQLQVNLVRSHACGVGAALTEAETRAVILLRANALAKGFSGVRPVVVETLCAMLNGEVHPVIPEKGSVGASGDLAPLAHLALVLIGEGEARYRGDRMAGGEAMKRAGIQPVALEAKEGLSVLNGTQVMLALLCQAIGEATVLADTADVAAALSLDALRGSPTAFDERIAKARPHPGHAEVARNLLRLNAGSQIRESHRSAARDPRVQDAYSLRCTPQVHGAVRDAIRQVTDVVTIELNSATDNPLVFAEPVGTKNRRDAGAPGIGGEVLSGGNFHGQPLAMAADQLAVALATLGGISERRTETMTNPLTSLLPAFLTREAGLNSGFMIAQVTAAALASELKMQATPHSVDSISTSGNQEDYVSMGMGAARRLRGMSDNLRNILAIELLAACQGINLLAPLKTGALAQKAYDEVRKKSAKVEADRALAKDIEAVAFLVEDGTFRRILQ